MLSVDALPINVIDRFSLLGTVDRPFHFQFGLTQAQLCCVEVLLSDMWSDRLHPCVVNDSEVEKIHRVVRAET